MRHAAAWALALALLVTGITGFAQTDPAIPADEEGAKAALGSTPRHTEYLNVPLPGSSVPIRAFVSYPERADKAPVVIVIHEIYGLSDWIRAVADQLAREGFIAVAPDLISGMGPGGGGTEAYASRDDVVNVIRGLSASETFRRLDAVRAFATALPSADGKSAVVGYCWGGAMSFGYAAVQPAISAAVVYYGTSPDAAALAAIKAPVQGHYGGDDERVNATIAPAQAEMKRLGKVYEPNIYAGAGHGFLRQQSGRDGANMAAARKAWPMTITFLREAFTK